MLSVISVSWALLLCLASNGCAQWLTTAYEWRSVDFYYPDPFMWSHFRHTKEHVPEAVVMLDVDVYKDRTFVTTPSLIRGTPATLSYLVSDYDKNGSPLLSPFPDWSWHNVTDPKDCRSIRNIFRIKIDSLGRLWAVDSGVSFAFSDRAGRINCNPKILVFDLNNHDKLLRVHEIDKILLDEDSLLLNLDVQIMNHDGSKTFVYIADSMGTKLIVYNYAKDEIIVHFHPYFFPDPSYGFYDLNGKKFTVTDGLFAVAIDKSKDVLFFHTLSSGRECSVKASLLRNGSLSEDQARQFVAHPNRPFHVSSEALTDDGQLVFASLEDNAIYSWDTDEPYTLDNFLLLAKDQETLQFVSGMKIIGDKILVISSRLQNMLVNGVPNKGEVNYRILVGDLKKVLPRSISAYRTVNSIKPIKLPSSTTSYAFSRVVFRGG